MQLTAMGVYSDNSTKDLTTQVGWSTSASTVASISVAGMSTGLTVGNATITATSGKVSGNTTLSVTSAVLKSIEVSPQNPSMPRNFILQFSATGVYTDNTTQDLSGQVSWASSQVNIASINSSGLATSAAAGKTVISASFGNVASGARSQHLDGHLCGAELDRDHAGESERSARSHAAAQGNRHFLRQQHDGSDAPRYLELQPEGGGDRQQCGIPTNGLASSGCARHSVVAIVGPIFSPASPS